MKSAEIEDMGSGWNSKGEKIFPLETMSVSFAENREKGE